MKIPLFGRNIKSNITIDDDVSICVRQLERDVMLNVNIGIIEMIFGPVFLYAHAYTTVHPRINAQEKLI